MARASLDQARETWQRTREQFKEATPTRIAYMGDGRGFATSNMIVGSKPTLIYARESPDDPSFFVVQNRTVQPAFNKQVILGFVDYEPGIEQVLDFVSESVLYDQGGSAVGQTVAHRQQHQFGGGDEVFIDARLFTPGLVRPTEPPSASVYVTPFSYNYNGWNRWGGGNSEALTDYKPTSGSRYVTISLDPITGELSYTPGNIYDDDTTQFSDIGISGGAGGWGAVPAPPGDEYPLATINLTPTTTQVNWQKDVLDNLTETRLHVMPSLRGIQGELDEVRRTIGLDATMTTAGAETCPTLPYPANAHMIRGVNVADTSPTDGQSLAYDQSQNSWAPSSVSGGSGSGEANTGSNVGAGIPVYREKSGVNLIFKSLAAGDNTTLASTASVITIAGTEASNTGENLGSGIGVYREVSGTSLLFKSLVGGDNTTLTSTASAITIAGTDASNTGENLGSGIGIYREVSGTSLLFKSLVGGSNVTLASTASAITINGPAGAGEANLGENLGSGIGIYREKSGTSLLFKTLVAGKNITLASTASDVTVTNSLSAQRFSVTIGASNTWNNELIPIWQGPRAGSATLVEINATTSGAALSASLSFNLQRRDFGSLYSAGIDIFAASQVATGTGLTNTSFATSVVGAKNHLMFTTGSAAESGSVNYLQITVYYTI